MFSNNWPQMAIQNPPARGYERIDDIVAVGRGRLVQARLAIGVAG